MVDVIWAAVEPMLPRRGRFVHPGRAVIGPGYRDRLCFAGDPGAGWRRAAHGSQRRRCSTDGRCRTRRCASRRDEWVASWGVRARSRPKRSPPMGPDRGTAISMTCASTGPPTKLPAAAKEPAKAPLTGANQGWKWSIAHRRGGRCPVAWAAARREPQRHHAVRPHHCRDRTTRPPSRHRDLAPRPRIHGAPASTGQPPACWASPTWCGPPKRKPGHDGPADTEPAHAPLGLRWTRRANQLMAVQLRAAATKHRPKTRAPPRPARPRRHPHHRHQTHRPPQPLATPQPPNPLTLLEAARIGHPRVGWFPGVLVGLS